ncbi:DUF3991 domain-containing protein [Paenibacillus pasadenensis]|uniref:DUF3991 domain-containing protein n=1 Tax=Paenibacillus pasadenensis TaxID=217090 RepID=UPI000C7DF806|nr:toprim domain-containing protein [Paenibacillus pasadenensis]
MAKLSNDDVRKARQTSLVDYLQKENEHARAEGRIEPWRLEPDGNQLRVRGFGGLMVRDNMWNQRSTGQGGNTLDFLVEFEKIPFKDAAAKLLDRKLELSQRETFKSSEEPKEPFKLPERNDSFRRVIAYLTKTRGLDTDIVLNEIKKGNLYEDKEHHNAVFVGKEPKSEEPRWAQKRTTLSDYKIIFEQPASDAKYPYFYGNRSSTNVILVESPIEALSYASLLKYHGKDPSQVAILALGGVHDTALKQYLRDQPHVKNIVTALNNDQATKPNEIKGREASDLIEERYSRDGGERSIYVKKIFPKGKDWNDDLRAIRADERAKNPLPEKERTVEDEIKAYSKMKAEQRQKERGPVRTRAR